MELEWKEYSYKDKKLSFTIKEKEINGISSNHLEEIIEIICLNTNNHKNIKMNHKEIKDSEWKDIEKKIVVVSEWIEDNIHALTVEELMIEYMKQRDIYPKDLKKKLKDSLKIVGLDASLLKQSIYACSTSEQKLIQIAEALLSNPEMLVLIEPFKVLDIKNRKKIMMVLKRIKDQYQKTIVIASNNPEILYKETEYVVIFKNDKVLVEDKTQEVYKRVDFLKKHRVEIPEIVDFTYLAKKKKNAKIDYFRDIRDIIKDIYKHV